MGYRSLKTGIISYQHKGRWLPARVEGWPSPLKLHLETAGKGEGKEKNHRETNPSSVFPERKYWPTLYLLQLLNSVLLSWPFIRPEITWEKRLWHTITSVLLFSCILAWKCLYCDLFPLSSSPALLVYVFIFGSIGSSLGRAGFSLVASSGGYSSLRSTGSVVVARGL